MTKKISKNKTKTTRRIIIFMEWKARKISKLLEIDKKKYFSPEDAEAINEWGEEKSLDVWKKMLSSDPLTDARICPFCQAVDMRCVDCSYGEEHKVCHLHDSDYVLIRKRAGSQSIVQMLGEEEILGKLKDL